MNATFEFSAFVDRLAGPAGLRLSLALLHFLWQGVLIAAGAAVLMRVLGRRSASRRYAIGVAGMALMAVAPVVTFCVVTPPEPVQTELAETAPEELLFEIERLEGLLGETAGGAGETGEAGGEVVDAAPLTWPERVRLWQPYALLAWLGGTGVFALRLGVGVRASRRFGRGRRPLPEAWLTVAIEVAGTLGIRTPRVFVSDRVVEAVAVGLLRPMVLIPAAWLGRVSPEVLEAVLAHELAHLRRYDLWVNLLQRCVEAALFYHPAVWWLSRRVRVEREYCCDETAATAVSGRAAYARALEFAATEAAAARRVATARPMVRGTALAAGMGGEPMALLERVRRVLGAEAKPPRGSWMSEGLLALAVPAALWAGVAAVGPAVAGEGSGGVGKQEKGGQEEADAAEGEGAADVLIYRDVTEEAEGDLVIYRDVLDEHPEGLGPEPVRVPMLDEVPFLGRLFRSEVDVDADGWADLLIARGTTDGEDQQSDEAEDEAEEDADGEDDVREILRELRAEMRALRGEVEELRGRNIGKRDVLHEVRPFPPEGPKPPHPPKPPHLESKFDGPHGGHGPHKPQVFIKEFRGDGKGPERFEVRVFKDHELKGPGPEKFVKRLDIEKVEGKPKVFFFREGKGGKPERVEGKPKGEQHVIELEEGRIHVRPLPPGKGHGDPRDEVIRRLEEELRRLRKELEASRDGKVHEARRMVEVMAREQAEAAGHASREAVEAKLDALRQQQAAMEDSLGDGHPKRQAIEALEEAREELEEASEARHEEESDEARDAEEESDEASDEAEDSEENAEDEVMSEEDAGESDEGNPEEGEAEEAAAREAAEQGELEAARAEIEAAKAELAAEEEAVRAEQEAVEEAQEAVEEAERATREAEPAAERAERDAAEAAAERTEGASDESEATEDALEDERATGPDDAGDEVGREVPAIERAFAFFVGMAR